MKNTKITNNAYIYIDDDHYAFGFITKRGTLITVHEHSYMAFLEEAMILYGDDAYNTIQNGVRIPVFSSRSRVEKSLETVIGHPIPHLNLSFEGISLKETDKINSTLTVEHCYYLMINFIFESFISNAIKHNITLDRFTIFLSDAMEHDVLNQIKNIMTVAAKGVGLKIQFINQVEAIKDRLAFKGYQYISEYQRKCLLLTIDIGNDNTRLELFNGIDLIAAGNINYGHCDFENKYLKAIEEVSESGHFKFDGFEGNNHFNVRLRALENLQYYGGIDDRATFYDLDKKCYHMEMGDIHEKFSYYFNNWGNSIKEFIIKSIKSIKDNDIKDKRIVYTFIGKTNSMIEKSVPRSFYDMKRYNGIEIESLDERLPDMNLFKYDAGAYYLCTNKNNFNESHLDQEVFDECSKYYNYFVSLRQWLNKNSLDHIDISTKIEKERLALLELSSDVDKASKLFEFQSYVNDFKFSHYIAEEFKEAYLQWRRQFCSDEQIAKLIPEMESGLF